MDARELKTKGGATVTYTCNMCFYSCLDKDNFMKHKCEKITITSEEAIVMKSELNYVCDKVTQNSGNTSISFCDSNWGLYKKDIILSDHILKLMNEKNWPSSIETATPKNKKQQMLDIDDKLKNRVKITLSQQSMNRDTLKLIKRDNMSNNEFLDFITQLEARGKNSTCELIVPSWVHLEDGVR